MAHVIGTGSYSPNAKFVTPRSYLAKVVNHSAGFALTQVGNVFTLNFAPTYVSLYTWIFHPDFWTWNSDMWILNRIITDCYYQQVPDPTKNPLDFTLVWSRSAPDHLPKLLFAPNGSFVTPIQASFPSFPLSYWARPT